MSEPRRRRNRHPEQDAPAREQTPPAPEAAASAGRRRRNVRGPEAQESRSWDSDSVWDDTPQEKPHADRHAPAKEDREVLTTDRTIRLCCTLAGVSALFALFLCFAERESRAIRHYAVSSVAIRAVCLAAGAVMYLVGVLFAGIPLMGFVIQLVCWLFFLGAAVLLAAVRVRMMLFAWNGRRYELPLLGRWLDKRFV